jgi:hypothetical protein
MIEIEATTAGMENTKKAQTAEYRIRKLQVCIFF